MATKRTDLRASEVAMRTLLATQRIVAKDPNFLLFEIVREVMKLGVSRACAFRHARLAVDVLAIPYAWNEERVRKFSEKMEYVNAQSGSDRRYARSLHA